MIEWCACDHSFAHYSIAALNTMPPLQRLGHNSKAVCVCVFDDDVCVVVDDVCVCAAAGPQQQERLPQQQHVRCRVSTLPPTRTLNLYRKSCCEPNNDETRISRRELGEVACEAPEQREWRGGRSNSMSDAGAQPYPLNPRP